MLGQVMTALDTSHQMYTIPFWNEQGALLMPSQKADEILADPLASLLTNLLTHCKPTHQI